MSINHFQTSVMVIAGSVLCKLPNTVHWENLPRGDTKMTLINTGIPDAEE